MSKKFAIVKGDFVDGIAIADNPLDTDGIWIDVTDMVPQPSANWRYQNGEFIAPPAPSLNIPETPT